MQNAHAPAVAVVAERASAYGRGFIRGIADFAAAHDDWNMELIDPADLTRHLAVPFDGWIVRSPDVRALRLLARLGRPVVDALYAHPIPSFAAVRTDNVGIGRLAARHFLSRRFASFAYCGYRRVLFSDLRRDGYARELKANGFRTAIFRPVYDPARRYGRGVLLGEHLGASPDAAELAAWLARLPRPLAVFCCDDVRAAEVLRLARRRCLRVPDDVAVLGVDDDPSYCMFSSPRLSSVDPDAHGIGVAAAETLAAMLAAPQAPLPAVRHIPPRGVVARASTLAYPGLPPWFPQALAFIREHVGEGISAADVFRHAGYSRTLVERAFAKALGHSVQREIAQVRVERARRLLRQTTKPVREVAALCGYASVEYFSRAFAAATGAPPARYRASDGA